MKTRCACCQGKEAERAGPTNRHGLSSIAYRVGTHATFLETMRAALSRHDLPALRGLTARASDDPAIAWLDGWATIADILSFYQERIANEGYLRTATERRSILELARLIGYALRPGVASSVFLAYSLENGHEVTIPTGSRVQSVPGPGELPQSFETAEDLAANAAWNTLRIRTSQPQLIAAPTTKTVFFKGTSTNLKAGDRLLFVMDGRPLTIDGEIWVPRVTNAELEAALDRTTVLLENSPVQAKTQAKRPTFELMAGLTRALARPPSQPPPAAAYLSRDRATLFDPGADTVPRLLGSLHPEVRSTLYGALQNAEVGGSPPVDVFVLRTRTGVFGHNAPKRPVILSADGRAFQGGGDWPLATAIATGPLLDLRVSVEGRKQVTVTGRFGDRSFEGAGLFAPDQEFRLGEFGVARMVQANDRGFDLILQFGDSQTTVGVTLQDGHVEVFGAGAHGTLAESTPSLQVTQSTTSIEFSGVWQRVRRDQATESPGSVSLDAVNPKIARGSWVVIERPDRTVAAPIADVTERSRSDYGLTGRTTVLDLPDGVTWIDPQKDRFDVIRGTSVLAESEKLELAEEPIAAVVDGTVIELAELYGGLQPGRWLIIAGERTDIADTTGVQSAELVMIGSVRHDVATVVDSGGGVGDVDGDAPGDDDDRAQPKLAIRPGERLHTFLALATGLAYSYKRDSVRLYGNVVRATHGETRHEVLASGDATARFLRAALKQPPLTYVSAATASGIASTLEVRVNEVRWHETERFAGLGPNDRRYLVRIDDEGQTSVMFGNGREGARPPTGNENIRATYRTGIGQSGNVGANRITLLASRPLGVKEVVNPLPATGGADRERRDEARRNAPFSVLSLDHLVSVQDYADFARTFGGVAKAVSARLSEGGGPLMHVTIAGAGDNRIEPTSDLYRNLHLALRRYGDPTMPVRVDVRALRLLVIQARVRVGVDYLWEFVEPKIRSAILAAFGFDARDLGQDATASEVLRVVQSVAGVDYVDLDRLDALPEAFTEADLEALTGPVQTRAHHRRLTANLARAVAGAIAPADLLVVSPLVPETLLLAEIPQ